VEKKRERRWGGVFCPQSPDFPKGAGGGVGPRLYGRFKNCLDNWLRPVAASICFSTRLVFFPPRPPPRPERRKPAIGYGWGFVFQRPPPLGPLIFPTFKVVKVSPPAKSFFAAPPHYWPNKARPQWSFVGFLPWVGLFFLSGPQNRKNISWFAEFPAPNPPRPRAWALGCPSGPPPKLKPNQHFSGGPPMAERSPPQSGTSGGLGGPAAPPRPPPC